MTNRCSGCGADLAMVGRSHRCIPRSRGGGEVTERPRKAGNKAGSIPAAAGTSTASRLVRGIEGETPRRSHAGAAPGLRDAKLTGLSDEAKAREGAAAVGVAKSRLGGARTTVAAQQAGVGSERTKSGQQSASKSRAGAKRLGARGPAPGHGGRPRKGEEHKTLMAQKPWEKAGVSRRTWYRQQERGK